MEPHLTHWSTMEPWTEIREKDGSSTIYWGKKLARKRSRRLMENCLLFLSGRLNPIRMAQSMPSVAANPNKQDFLLTYSNCEEVQEMKGPAVSYGAWRLTLKSQQG